MKVLTVNDLINMIKNHPEDFPNGLNTKIYSGDQECNFTHIYHEIQTDENAIVLSYEKYENYGEL